MPLSAEDRDELKRPFGKLVADKDVSKHTITSLLENSKTIVSVGDATTERLLSLGIIPDIAVIDGKERRASRKLPGNYPATEMQCKNPSGTISKNAIGVLQKALETRPPVRVIVDGEEDMLALPLFAMAPQGSAVLYGQPLEGVVVVDITAAKQKEAKDLMDRIGIE